MTFARKQGFSANYPFKPEREPEHINHLPPHRENILTAIAENSSSWARVSSRRKGQLRSLGCFTSSTTYHQPLHAVQLFTREYSNGDRGGNELCLRVAADRAAIDLHRLGWIDYVDEQLGVACPKS